MSNSDNGIFQKEEPARFSEVLRFYKRCRDRSKIQANDSVYTLLVEGVIVAALRLQLRGSVFFLRSVCVDPGYQRQGLAIQLIKAAVAEQKGLSGYCFLQISLQGLYRKAGFVCGNVADAQDTVRDQYHRLNKNNDIVYMVTNDA